MAHRVHLTRHSSILSQAITLEEAQPKLEAAQTRLIKNVTAMNALRRALATWDEEAYESSLYLPLPTWYASARDRAKGE